MIATVGIAGGEISEEEITFELIDERTVSVSLSWSRHQEEASPEEQQNFSVSPSGYSVHWPDVDEDLSAWGAPCGSPSITVRLNLLC